MGKLRFYPDRPLGSYHKCDTGIIVSMIILWGLGIFTLFFCSSAFGENFFNDRFHFIKRQLFFSIIGFAGLLAFAIVPLSKMRKMLPLFVLASVVLCLFPLVPGIGEELNGARRWIRLPFFSFQPSECLKLTTVLFLANFIDKYERKSAEERSVFPAVFMMLLFFGIIILQKDFSTSVFIFFIGLLMFFVSGLKVLWIVPFIVLAVPAVIMLILSESYRLNRLQAFISPNEFLDSVNYQPKLAATAINRGGFWGMGIGAGLEKFKMIPEVHTDYIFAGWAEAMGFVGVIFYFGLLCVFAFKVYKAAFTCPDRFGAMGIFGCMSMILFQSFMNCAVVCGSLPSTGIPLPFFSSGGSSIIITLCMCGFIINAARGDCDSAVEEGE